ncbi:MAG: beta-ketoacyl-ACP synthase II [Rhodothermales bacterium]|nr:beta-ketoacyl-ACP synthase II [Rhodothermales bacterium]
MINEMRRVVITGMGALTPIGLDVETFWQGMMEGKSGAGPITAFDASDYPTRFACELKGFDVLAFMDKKATRRADRFTQLAIVAADQAIKDAGIDSAALSTDDRDGTAVIFGSGIGGLQTFQEQTEIYLTQGPNRISPFFIPMLIPDIAAGHISMKHGFRGPNYAIVSACATGNNNIGDAFVMIQRGLIHAAVCGGSEAAVNPLGIGGFCALKALSTRNDTPETASRPFDATRDGFVLGEGAGALYLEELDFALQRGARIYAEIVGIGLSGDAYHLTAPDPEGNGARLAMLMALRDAGIKPTDVDYINMHGTSTPLGDVAESKAIEQVFGEHAYRLNVSSTKSMTGHLLGAAGAVEAIASILATKYDIIPPTINFKEKDESCRLNYTFNTPHRRTVQYAVSNAFGFGGHNTSVVFKKYAEA